jgi:HPt (histidine-containing phosphotransfer) domain-containing protein
MLEFIYMISAMLSAFALVWIAMTLQDSKDNGWR